MSLWNFWRALGMMNGPKGAWSGSSDLGLLFKFWDPPVTFERVKLDTSFFLF